MGVGGRRRSLAPLLPTTERYPVHIVQEAGWTAGLVWTGAENLASPRFDPCTVQPGHSRNTGYAIPAQD
jgi:hypothetical protein